VRRLVALSIVIALAGVIFGLNLYGNFTLNSTNTTDLIGASGTIRLWNTPAASMSYIFDFQMARNDLAMPFYGYMTFGHYWYINNAYFLFPLKNLRVKVGRMHFVEGPGKFYHLFLSDSAGPFNGLSIQYTPNNSFSFKQDMIFLNDINPRSLYYRRFTIHPLNGLSLSYEESVLFMREFDPWYAFVMLPYPAIEVFRQEKSLWQQKFNDNAFVGFFMNYKFGISKVYSEFLADDLDMNFIFAPNKFQNPNKLAWLIGGQTELWNVKITAEYAGATAYTFETTTGASNYAYVVYPSWNNIDQNMIGYKYGENNDALKIGIDYPMKFATLNMTYEHVRLGKRTPTVPWHGLSHVPSGTHWLDGSVIETRNIIGIDAQIKWRNLKLEPALSYENIQNADLRKGVNTNNWTFSISIAHNL